MPLEDHAGDIVRKARARSRVALAEAARAGGISVAALKQFEADGNWPTGGNVAALAALVALDAAKLQGVLAGWEPAAPPNRWRELRVMSSARQGFAVNAYLVWDCATREAALFDTGFDVEAIAREIQQNGLNLRVIAITHSHRDHVAVLPALAEKFPAARIVAAPAVHPRAQQLGADEASALGALQLTARATPGHADDGVTYVVRGWPAAAPAVAVVGDVLFAGSVGGADTSWADALGRARSEILSLPGETLLCPGHGPLTTVAEELAHNPFF